METLITQVEKEKELINLDQRRIGRISISKELLGMLLGLPEEAEVLCVTSSVEQGGLGVNLTIRHPELSPVTPGLIAPVLYPLFRMTPVEINGKEKQIITVENFGIEANGNGNLSSELG